MDSNAFAKHFSDDDRVQHNDKTDNEAIVRQCTPPCEPQSTWAVPSLADTQNEFGMECANATSRKPGTTRFDFVSR